MLPKSKGKTHARSSTLRQNNQWWDPPKNKDNRCNKILPRYEIEVGRPRWKNVGQWLDKTLHGMANWWYKKTRMAKKKMEGWYRKNRRKTLDRRNSRERRMEEKSRGHQSTMVGQCLKRWKAEVIEGMGCWNMIGTSWNTQFWAFPQLWTMYFLNKKEWINYRAGKHATTNHNDTPVTNLPST